MRLTITLDIPDSQLSLVDELAIKFARDRKEQIERLIRIGLENLSPNPAQQGNY